MHSIATRALSARRRSQDTLLEMGVAGANQVSARDRMRGIAIAR